MKTIVHLTILSAVIFSYNSCKNKKSTTTSASSYTTVPPQNTTTVVPVPPPTTTITATQPQNDNVRFIVSFYSIGQGIDLKANDEFVKFLDSYQKKISYTPTHWGREGEIDYCLALTELSASEQTEFVKKANEILSKSNLVHQKENAKCEHKALPPLNVNPAPDIFRMVVSFFSTAAGIDGKINDEFVKFLDTYPKKIAYEPTHWGREGEIDYCLKLSELSTAEQEDFVKKAKVILSKSSLVNINENAACVHKH